MLVGGVKGEIEAEMGGGEPLLIKTHKHQYLDLDGHGKASFIPGATSAGRSRCPSLLRVVGAFLFTLSLWFWLDHTRTA